MRKQITPTCSRSQISVVPANWNKANASAAKKWKIYYRYYDSQFVNDKAMWGKMFVLKGMNDVKLLSEKQAITKALIEQESDLLDNRLFNPITRRYMDGSTQVQGGMTFKEAMVWACDKIEGVKGTKVELHSSLKGILQSAETIFNQDVMLTMADTPINHIKRRHIKEMLDNCYNVRRDRRTKELNFSSKRYNVYKKHIARFYRELVDAEIVETNIAADIRSKPVVKPLKEILTDEEADVISNHLHEVHYKFWRFVILFFYSDCRLSEFVQLKKDARVSLDKQEFIVTVIKGKARRQVEKQISNEVLYLWQELMNEAKDGEYLFSTSAAPGNEFVGAARASKRWHKYVKIGKEDGGLGINKDLRSLNHLHLTKVSEAVGIKAAAASRSHTTPVITMTRYDVGHKKRLLDEVRNAGVKFGK